MVVQVLSGPPLDTWATAADAISLEEAWLLFGSAANTIHRMRPLHHRDITPFNLVYKGNSGTQIIDLDNARWGKEASLYERRSQQDDQLSEDDAYTGTPSFLPRAAFKRQAAYTHRHYHDLESLVLCLVWLVFHRFRKDLPGVDAVFADWIEKPMHANQQSQLFRGLPGDLMQQIRAARAQIDRSTLQQMVIVEEALTELTKVFGPSDPAATNLMASDEEELASLFSLSDKQEDAMFSSANQLAKRTASRLGQLPCSLRPGRRVQPLRTSRQKVPERAREDTQHADKENIPPVRPKKAQRRLA